MVQCPSIYAHLSTCHFFEAFVMSAFSIQGVDPVQVFDIIDSRCEVASDYHKKKNVFRLK